jgi:hypothetical protein
MMPENYILDEFGLEFLKIKRHSVLYEFGLKILRIKRHSA